MIQFGNWRQAMSCRLCWKVALAVFTLILAIESVILVPSAQRFERTELERLANWAELQVEPVLALGRGLEDPQALERSLEPLVRMYGIDALALYRKDGSLAASLGAQPAPVLPAEAYRTGRMAQGVAQSRDGTKLEVAWGSHASGAPVAVARVDASAISRDLAGYLLRIGALVALIVLVVTAGTMFVLGRLVLQPVLRLRESSLAAGADPEGADRHVVPARRHDELGELIEAHNSLLGRVAESKRRDRAVAEERARFLSHHEPLSGFPNRVALIEFVDRLAAREAAAGRCVSVLLFNVNQFRVLNASFGAERCDELLRQLAGRLRHAASARDFVAHLGADRFAVVHEAEECGAASVAALAERLLAETSRGYDLGGTTLASLAVRAGISRSEGRASDGRTLLTEAELAAARVKETERAAYQFYSAELAEQARKRQALARDLERALGTAALYPVMQPRFALEASGGTRLAGAELLLRWNDAERGMVSPAEFIPLAESTGLIVPIGEFVLRAACAQIRTWQGRYGWSPRLAVNLSARQFAEPGLEAELARVISQAGIAAPQLEVEVTESAAMRDVAQTAETLAALRALGVKVSIDDFGTGYSSLSYLRRFAVDAIKIDKSFVDDIGVDANAEAICDAVLRLGQSLGTKVVAEGVEHERQVAFLRRRRCDEVQGYYFGKPLPAAEFESSWLAARAAA